jgi:hypothetical protein
LAITKGYDRGVSRVGRAGVEVTTANGAVFLRTAGVYHKLAQAETNPHDEKRYRVHILLLPDGRCKVFLLKIRKNKTASKRGADLDLVGSESKNSASVLLRYIFDQKHVISFVKL